MASNETVNADALAQFAEMRSKVYALLTHFYSVAPDRQFVEQMRDGTMAATLEPLLDEEMPEAIRNGIRLMLVYLRNLPSGEFLDDLATERTRLLRGIKRGYGPPPPYESVYCAPEESEIWKTVAEIKRVYRAGGVAVPDDAGEMADYIGLELDFLRHLAAQEAQAWRTDDTAAAEEWRAKQDNFLQMHIVTWIPRFCDQMRTDASSGFYQGLAELTKGFVLSDMA